MDYILIAVLIIIAGFSNAIMDTIAHKGGGRLPEGDWWDMEKSWRLKWKNGDPNQGERFFLSSTVFVFVTDAWHFFQFIMLSAFALAIAIGVGSHVMIVFLVTKGIFSFSFESLWRLVNRKK